MHQVVKELEKIISYSFKNKELLKEALTHPSVVCPQGSAVRNYERFEFLGDSVLSLVISELLLKKFPDINEGHLSKKRSFLVSGEVIVRITSSIGLGKYIYMSAGEEKEGGRSNLNNIENVLEALIGAIYLDGGLAKVKTFIKSYWLDYLDRKAEISEDPKSILQEWLQSQGFPLPVYKIVSSEGSAHLPIFNIELKVEGFKSVYSSGSSKKKAEKVAALKFLQIVNYETN